MQSGSLALCQLVERLALVRPDQQFGDLNSCARGLVPKGVVLALTGHLWLGQYRSDWVGRWTTDATVVTFNLPFQTQSLLP
ncbi:hypothetical protein [Amycolatopsis taiwanensis]|uniref:hypothetical protein n=1 Tax=Amycolatopsis taiwanensis TaxID=342230 RepID=UPI00048544C4|nr:hypothetical protein [Amycolatopsis taiwanensis]